MSFQVTGFSTDYSIEVDYDTSRNCNSSCHNDMCRCGVITNTSIESVNVSWSDFRFSQKKGFFGKKHLSEVDKYCLNRLIALNGGFNKENYELNISNGYYGEELIGCYFNNETKLVKEAQELLDLETEIEKIFFVLKKEYSYIAPLIADCNQVELIKVKLSNIQPSSGGLMMKSQTSYLYNVEEEDEVKGILFGDMNLIVDGNHRLSYLINKLGDSSKKQFTYIKLGYQY
jgi:hypothetical protein